MNENYERIKVTMFQMLVMVFVLVVVGILMYLTNVGLDFSIYKISGSISTVFFGIGVFFRMKYSTYELNRSEKFLKLINSNKVTELKNLSDITIYKIKSRYSFMAMKFSVSYIDGKTVVNGPKLLGKIFINNDIC